MKLHVINTGLFKLDGGAMFGVVPKKLWNKEYKADKNNLVTWALRCLLVEDGDRRILIDCGLGNKQDDKFFSHYEPHGKDTLESSLADAGFTTDDITDVLLTHLHFDHCGGAVTKKGNGQLVPTFKNATYWSHSLHWKWAADPNDREKASFLEENIAPIEKSGQLKFVDKTFFAFDNIDYVFAHGHTEAQIIPLIRYKNKTIAYCADLLPSVGHIPLPWVMGYDIRPMVTLEEKAEFLKDALKEKYVLFFEHDALHECCTLEKTPKGIRAKKTFPLADIL